jgi:GTPase SAR1 family protein
MSSEQAKTAQARRIHIIGGSGSGKTTLARRLAKRLEVPTHDLDEIAYEDGSGAKRPVAARLEDAHRIAIQPGWVTEGIYLWWTEELLQAADVIVWLDLPWRVAAGRILARHVRASLAGNNRHRGLRKLLGFLSGTRSYYAPRGRAAPCAPDDDGATSRVATVEWLEGHAAKVIRCRRAVDVTLFQLSIEDTSGTGWKKSGNE